MQADELKVVLEDESQRVMILSLATKQVEIALRQLDDEESLACPALVSLKTATCW